MLSSIRRSFRAVHRFRSPLERVQLRWTSLGLLRSTIGRYLSSTRYFSEEHEWVTVDESGVGTIGISDHAQIWHKSCGLNDGSVTFLQIDLNSEDQLGDIVYVSLPAVGEAFDSGDEFGTVESVKSASSLYCPVGGKVVDVNKRLESDEGGDPSLVNRSPYDEGWILKVKLRDESELKILMDETAYLKFVGTAS